MLGNTNEFSSEEINSGDAFVELVTHAENLQFDATGEMSAEVIERLKLAEAELNRAPCLPSVSFGHVPGIGDVELCFAGNGLLACTVGGMRTKMVRRHGRWILTMDGGGPHALDEDHLAVLEDKARRIKEYFFGKEGRVALKACTLALYCHLHPDPSDAESTADAYEDLVDGRITRAEGWHAPIRVLGSREKVESHRFGSLSAARQVRTSAWGGEYPSPSAAEEYAGLMESIRYQEDREIIGVELIFHCPFIRKVTRSSDLNLSSHLRELVRVTLGDETLPYPFFRVATMESKHLLCLPDSLRPNSAAWEHVRKAFLKEVAPSEQSI